MASIAYVDGQGNVRYRDVTTGLGTEVNLGTTGNPDVFTFANADIGLRADTAATSNTGSFSLISLFKRYLDLFTALGIGSVSDTAATSNTGSFSLISLFKRFLNAFTRPAIVYGNGTLANTTGTDIVAPGASNTVYITHLIFQNTNATTTTINVRYGTTTILSIVLPQNSVYSVAFPERREMALPTNTAFNLQATTANAIVYSVGYYTGAV